MKINNVFGVASFPSSGKNNKKEVQNNTINYTEFSKIDSKYYRANSPAFKGAPDKDSADCFVVIPKVVNGKLASISCTVFVDENTTHNFEIPKEDCAKYLLAKDGTLNSEYLTKYVQTYRNIVQRELDAHRNLIGKNLEILKECAESKKAKSTGEAFERKILPSISEDKLAKFALTFNQHMALDETNEQYSEAAKKETNAIFELSKIDDGYDFSNIEQKKQIITHYNNFANNYPSFVKREGNDITISGLIEISKARKGKIDLDFIELVARFISSTEGIPRDYCVADAAGCAEKIATIGNIKDKNFTDCVFKVINDYAFCKCDELDYLKILINPKTKKFDKEYADGIRAKLEEACECIEDYELDVNWEKPDLSWDMVKDYLEYSENTPNFVTFKEYVLKNRYRYAE